MEVQVIKSNAAKKQKLKVAAYARVSRDEDETENSIENQINHYTELIQENPEYEFVEVYYDFGISGFKENRPGFQRMMKDARAGKIDLIYTKSITRFARNTDTFLKATRELKEKGIGVFFELQNINSLTQAGELLMTVYAAFAQAESENYSSLVRLAKQRNFEKGTPQMRLDQTLGFTFDEEGKVKVVPDEAKDVKQLFEWTREGYLPTQILNLAKKNGITRRDGKNLDASLLHRTIRNEAYKGDYIMQKYFIDENRKAQLNRGEFPMYYVEDNHPAIVSRKLWDEANKVLEDRAKERLRHVEIKPFTKENYPYKGKLYCAKCGHKLYSGVTKANVQRTFFCGGNRRFGDSFCTGVFVTQKEVETWGEITDNIYISFDETKPRQNQYSFVKESTWKKSHKKVTKKDPVVPYTPENYHYYKRVFCEKCGNRLTRNIQSRNKIFFSCIGYIQYGKSFCTGMRVPQEVLDRLPEKDGYFIIKEEVKDGKKSYSYTCKAEKPERKRKRK